MIIEGSGRAVRGTAGEKVHGNTEEDDAETDPRVHRLDAERVHDDGQRGGDEDHRRDGVERHRVAAASRTAASEQDQAQREGREEQPLGIDHAREQGTEGAGGHQQRRHDALQDDGAMRGPVPGALPTVEDLAALLTSYEWRSETSERPGFQIRLLDSSGKRPAAAADSSAGMAAPG